MIYCLANLISKVAKARIDEIFERIKKQINLSGFNLNSGISLLLTGGGSNLLNVDEYCMNFFGINVKKTKENNINGKDSQENFFSCLGALKILKDGWETEAIPERGSKNIKKIGLFSKIFGLPK